MVVVGIFSLHPSLNKGDSAITKLHYYVYGNDFNLSCMDVVDHTSIKVKWSCENNDVNCKELVIYKDGEKINDIPFEKGEQRLTVYYNNQLIGTLDQNKLKKAQAHKYQIQVSATDNEIKFSGNIQGPSPGKSAQSSLIEELILASY